MIIEKHVVVMFSWFKAALEYNKNMGFIFNVKINTLKHTSSTLSRSHGTNTFFRIGYDIYVVLLTLQLHLY